MARNSEPEKPFSAHVEAPLDEKDIGSMGQDAGDYSGAVKKTNPEEIKLVRKLDVRIMSTLWAMYFLVSNDHIGHVYKAYGC
jgi:hypothetical protein